MAKYFRDFERMRVPHQALPFLEKSVRRRVSRLNGAVGCCGIIGGQCNIPIDVQKKDPPFISNRYVISASSRINDY